MSELAERNRRPVRPGTRDRRHHALLDNRRPGDRLRWFGVGLGDAAPAGSARPTTAALLAVRAARNAAGDGCPHHDPARRLASRWACGTGNQPKAGPGRRVRAGRRAVRMMLDMRRTFDTWCRRPRGPDRAEQILAKPVLQGDHLHVVLRHAGVQNGDGEAGPARRDRERT